MYKCRLLGGNKKYWFWYMGVVDWSQKEEEEEMYRNANHSLLDMQDYHHYHHHYRDSRGKEIYDVVVYWRR